MQKIAIRSREVILPLCLVLARPQDTQLTVVGRMKLLILGKEPLLALHDILKIVSCSNTSDLTFIPREKNLKNNL